LLSLKFEELYAKLEEKHGIKIKNKLVVNSITSLDKMAKLVRGKLVCIVLNPKLFSGTGTLVTSILKFSKHLLLESIVLDNCGTTHLMNDVRKLDEGTYIPLLPGLTIESGTQSIPVIGRSTCMIKGILNNKNNKGDLILRNVTIVEGFVINIIFEALLREIRA
jgi:hypothetical protein